MFPTAEFRNKERAKYIEKQKHRQELKRQAEEKAAAARKAVEKTPYEKVLDKQEEVKRFINGIQPGDVRNEEYIAAALKRICEIVDYCLTENKSVESTEE